MAVIDLNRDSKTSVARGVFGKMGVWLRSPKDNLHLVAEILCNTDRCASRGGACGVCRQEALYQVQDVDRLLKMRDEMFSMEKAGLKHMKGAPEIQVIK